MLSQAEHMIQKLGDHQNSPSAKGLLLAPAYHKPGHEVVRALKQALDRMECSPGQHLEQQRFGQLLGIPKSTVHDWFHGKLPVPVQSLLCAFERMTETERILFLREFCRPCPRLEHPRLAHDTATLNRLKALLNQPAGVTVVVGPSEPRTFLVTALGHAITRVEPKRRVCGLDIHRPNTFVPVAGVLYCQQPPEPQQAGQLAAHVLGEIERADAELVIFNGIWSGISQFPRAIRRLAASRHLIMADEFASSPGEFIQGGLVPVQFLVASPIEGMQGLIHVDFQSPRRFRTTR